MNYVHAIKTARGMRGLSQKELAIKIGKSPGYVSKIEGGTRVPATEVIEEICKALEMPYYLFALLATEEKDINNIPYKETKTLTDSLLQILVSPNDRA